MGEWQHKKQSTWQSVILASGSRPQLLCCECTGEEGAGCVPRAGWWQCQGSEAVGGQRVLWVQATCRRLDRGLWASCSPQSFLFLFILHAERTSISRTCLLLISSPMSGTRCSSAVQAIQVGNRGVKEGIQVTFTPSSATPWRTCHTLSTLQNQGKPFHVRGVMSGLRRVMK